MFWDSRGEHIGKVKGSKAEFRNLNCNQRGDRLLTASDNLRMWTKDGGLLKERNIGSYIWDVSWKCSDDKIATTCEDGKVFNLDKELKK